MCTLFLPLGHEENDPAFTPSSVVKQNYLIVTLEFSNAGKPPPSVLLGISRITQFSSRTHPDLDFDDRFAEQIAEGVSEASHEVRVHLHS